MNNCHELFSNCLMFWLKEMKVPAHIYTMVYIAFMNGTVLTLYFVLMQM